MSYYGLDNTSSDGYRILLGGSSQSGCANLLFCILLLSKTAWKSKNLDPRGHASLVPPLDPSMISRQNCNNFSHFPQTSGGGLLAAGFAFGAAVGSVVHIMNQVVDCYFVVYLFATCMQFLSNVWMTLGIIIECKCRSIFRTCKFLISGWNGVWHLWDRRMERCTLHHNIVCHHFPYHSKFGF